jgi:hypothetical protein
MIRKQFPVIAGLLLMVASQDLLAEGSYQVGLNQPLMEEEDISAPLYVDIVSVGEVINVSACGEGLETDSIHIEIFDPDGVSVLDTTLSSANVSCSDPFTAPLTNPVRYTTLKTGSYQVNLNNTTFGSDELYRFDISVTPNTSTNPDPTENAGRLWAYEWAFWTHTFSESAATDSDYYPLVPGGRTDTNYVWKLDLNNFSGNFYVLRANDLGVDAPYSGYSVYADDGSPIGTPTGTVTPKFPIYVSYPVVAQDRPVDPPVVTNFRFLDDASVDFGISPSTTPGTQDSGNFTFDSDVAGTYSIIIDTDRNGVYGANDKLLLGNAIVGTNTIAWSGDDASGSTLSANTYNARIQVRLGEYHFISEDAETSGGPVEDGLTIFLANSDGSTTDTYVYWDDETFLSASGGTSNLPEGALSSTSDGKHTWGDFTGTSLGNETYVDTYVYGLSSYATTQTAITSDDTLLIGNDGIVTSTPATFAPGDSLTIQVVDSDLNILPTVAESVVVEVSNGRTGEVEQITLTETAVNSGIFSVAMPTLAHPAAGTNNDGTMQVWDGDTITASYWDQLDSVGGSQTRTDTSSAVNDNDGDGITDSNDLDDDNDGIPDTNEDDATVDTDGDGVVDSFDIDSDNDGLFDLVESGAVITGLDSNNDGVIDSGISFGTNGLVDGLETTADSGAINYTLADTDSDSVHDFRDVDSDNDGITDVIESGGLDGDGDGVVGTGTPSVDANGNPAGGSLTVVDSDGDNIGDQQELDADNDGIHDLVEAGGSDSNNDGLVDGFTDSNGDGLDDTIAASPLTPTDTNGDGTLDFQDNTDTDGDGLVDTVDLDDDNDSILDTDEGSEAVDTDGDGVADSLDLDSDNDGLFDLIESGATVTGLDLNSDGRIDGSNSFGANGLADSLETSADSGAVNYTLRDADSDTVHDFRDLDSDNDGMPDVIEAGGSDADEDGLIGSGAPVVDANGVPTGGGLNPPDTDGDSVTDQIDIDKDGDGLYDLVEAGGSDADNNGRIDGFSDLDTDGLHDALSGSALPIPDTDSDSVVDALDLDSDNDGIYDVLEAGGSDGDGDGLLGNSPQTVDASGAATGSGLSQVDSDGDTVLDRHDLDSDNDGIPDVTEAGGSDPDGDGRVGSGAPTVDANGVTAAPILPGNADGDALPNHLDLDSDGDTLFDIVEGGGSDINADGRVDGLSDGNGDGLDDSIASSPLPLPDSDSDTLPDYLDADDLDGDGVPDPIDLDLDNDGIPNSLEGDGSVDTDGDGIADSMDLDSDNDGLFDLHESGANAAALDTNDDGRIDSSEAVGANGIADAVESAVDSGAIGYNGGTLRDTDSDGVADFRDLDSDNDGLYDVTETGGSDPDADGVLGSGTPTVNGDGMAPGSGSTPPDTDGDGVDDQLDLDSDNDGLTDVVEGGGSDPDYDGIVGTGSPTVDPNTGVSLVGGGLVAADQDGDGTPNFQDTDSDNDGVFDVEESGSGATDDSPKDGVIDTVTDSNGNGLDDALEGVAYTLPDTDGDGIPDVLDHVAGTSGSSSTQPLQTGLNGVGGCSVAKTNGVDPLLPLLVLFSLLYLGKYRRQRVVIRVK